MKRYDVIRPSWYERFSCKGPDCKYDCCQEWSITLSRDENKKYKKNHVFEKCGENAMVELLSAKVRSDLMYVKIHLNEERRCPFQRKDGLCDVQCKFGEDMLSNTCRKYPRMNDFYGNIVSQNMSLGCERILELLLEEKEGISLLTEVRTFSDDEFWRNYWSQNTRRKYPILWHYYDIQTLCILLLQAEGDTLENRMILLGMALQNIDRLYTEGRREEIPQYIESFLEEAQHISIDELFANVNTDSFGPLYYSISTMLLEARIHQGRLEELLDKIKDKLHIEFKVLDEENIYFELQEEDYRAYRESFAKWIDGKEYFLENLMVSFLMEQRIPFHDLDVSLWDNYVYLVWTYSVVKFFLSVCLDADDTDDDMIYYLAVFFRALGHNKFLFDRVVADFKEHGDSLAHLCMVLRNC